jgi:hypothetical protein
MGNAASESPVRGACLCGAVQFEIALPTVACVHCHCTMCRRAHGAGYVTWVIVPTPQLRITAGSERLSRYQSSDHGARRFCGVCGSSLFGESTRTKDEMYVVLANLQAEIDRAPEFHACFRDRADWVVVADDLPHIEDAGILTTRDA